VAVFRRLDGRDLLVTKGPGEPVLRVPPAPFSSVSFVRWCEEGRQLVATASPADRPAPEAVANRRGDLRLFRCDPREGGWHQVYRGYAHDPICLPDGGYVVHRGAGLTFLDNDGAVRREVKEGRFNWGPPSLSLNPAGDLVAWIRWKGDAQKLCVDAVDGGRSARLRASVYRYAWLDASTILYLRGARPRLLDVATGATRAFGRGLRNHVRDGVPGAIPLLEDLARRPADELWEFYDDVQIVGDDVWLSATLTEQVGPGRVDGVFRTDPAAGRLHLVATTAPNDRIEGFLARPDRSVLIRTATYRDTTIVDRGVMTVGPMAEFLASGWAPVLTSREPDFGFHGLPGTILV
jgi:hypothetical protein